jgi:hypothetical protein
MKRQLATLSLILGLLTGCAAPVNAEPTQSSQAAQNPESQLNTIEATTYIVGEMNKPGTKMMKIGHNSVVAMLGTGEVKPDEITRFKPFIDKLFQFLETHSSVQELDLGPFEIPQDQILLFINRTTGHFFDIYGEATLTDASTNKKLTVLNFASSTQSQKLRQAIQTALGNSPESSQIADQVDRNWSVAQGVCLGHTDKDVLADPQCNVFAANAAMSYAGLTVDQAKQVMNVLGRTTLSEAGILPNQEQDYRVIGEVYDAFKQ